MFKLQSTQQLPTVPYKYFIQPDRFAIFLPAPTRCDFCETEKRCFDGATFQGSEPIAAICEDCLATGKLRNRDTFVCEGDIVELQRQLQALKPEKREKTVSKYAGEITDDLERTTPPIFTHQSWYWPCSGGDYCGFLGYGSKSLYNLLATDGNGEDFFLETLYYTVEDLSDVDELWEIMPEAAITNVNDVKFLDTLFYVFKSQSGRQVVTVWDTR